MYNNEQKAPSEYTIDKSINESDFETIPKPRNIEGETKEYDTLNMTMIK